MSASSSAPAASAAFCDLCESAAATVRCAECAPGGLALLCPADDASMHADAKRRSHHRVSIATGETITQPSSVPVTPPAGSPPLSQQASPRLPPAQATAPVSSLNLSAARPSPIGMPPRALSGGSSTRNSLLAGTSPLPSPSPPSTGAPPIFAPLLPSKRGSLLSNSGERSPGSGPMASPTGSPPSMESLSRKSSFIGSSQLGSPVRARESAKRICQLCETDAATIYCSTCKTDPSITSSQYCTQCDKDFHMSKRLEFHFRQTLSSAASAIVAAEMLDHARNRPESPVRDEEEILMQAAMQRRRAAAAGQKQATEPSPAEQFKGTTEEQLAAMKIQSVYRGAAVRRTNLLKLPNLPVARTIAPAAPVTLVRIPPPSASPTAATSAGVKQVSLPIFRPSLTVPGNDPNAAALFAGTPEEQLAASKIQRHYRTMSSLRKDAAASIKLPMKMPEKKATESATAASLSIVPTSASSVSASNSATISPPGITAAAPITAVKPAVAAASAITTSAAAPIALPSKVDPPPSEVFKGTAAEQDAARKIQSVYRGAAVRKEVASPKAAQKMIAQPNVATAALLAPSAVAAAQPTLPAAKPTPAASPSNPTGVDSSKPAALAAASAALAASPTVPSTTASKSLAATPAPVTSVEPSPAEQFKGTSEEQDAARKIQAVYRGASIRKGAADSLRAVPKPATESKSSVASASAPAVAAKPSPHATTTSASAPSISASSAATTIPVSISAPAATAPPTHPTKSSVSFDIPVSTAAPTAGSSVSSSTPTASLPDSTDALAPRKRGRSEKSRTLVSLKAMQEALKESGVKIEEEATSGDAASKINGTSSHAPSASSSDPLLTPVILSSSDTTIALVKRVRSEKSKTLVSFKEIRAALEEKGVKMEDDEEGEAKKDAAAANGSNVSAAAAPQKSTTNPALPTAAMPILTSTSTAKPTSAPASSTAASTSQSAPPPSDVFKGTVEEQDAARKIQAVYRGAALRKEAASPKAVQKTINQASAAAPSPAIASPTTSTTQPALSASKPTSGAPPSVPTAVDSSKPAAPTAPASSAAVAAPKSASTAPAAVQPVEPSPAEQFKGTSEEQDAARKIQAVYCGATMRKDAVASPKASQPKKVAAPTSTSTPASTTPPAAAAKASTTVRTTTPTTKLSSSATQSSTPAAATPVPHTSTVTRPPSAANAAGSSPSPSPLHSPSQSPLASPSSTSSSSSSSASHALLLSKLESLEARLLRETPSLHAERLAREHERYESEVKAAREKEEMRTKWNQMERAAAKEWERRESEFILRLSQLEDSQREALEEAEKKAKRDRDQALHELERLLAEATADRELAAEQLREQRATASRELERIALEALEFRLKAEKDEEQRKEEAERRQQEMTRATTEHRQRTEQELKAWLAETRAKKEEQDRVESERSKQASASLTHAAEEARNHLLTTSQSLTVAAEAARSHFHLQASLGRSEVVAEMREHAEVELRKQIEEERKKQEKKEAQQRRLARTLAQQQRAAALAHLDLERSRIREEELQRLIGFGGLTEEQRCLLKARREVLRKEQREIEQAGRGGFPVKMTHPSQAYPQYPGSPVRSNQSVNGSPMPSPSPYSHSPASPYSSRASPLVPPGSVTRLQRWPVGGLSAAVAAHRGWNGPTDPAGMGAAAPYGDAWAISSHPSTPSTKPRSYFDAFLESRRSPSSSQQQLGNGIAPPHGSPSSHAAHQPHFSYPHSSPAHYRPLSSTSSSSSSSFALRRRTDLLQSARVADQGGVVDEELEVSFLMDSPSQRPREQFPEYGAASTGLHGNRPSSAQQLHSHPVPLSPPTSARPSARGGRGARQQAKWTTEA